MRISALLVLAACGSKQPASVRVVAPPVQAIPQPATCADVGVILRGDVENANDDGAKAKEQVIARACNEDQWSQAVIDCIAGTAQPKDCIDKLSEDQLDKLNERVVAWRDKFSIAQDADLAPTISCSQAILDATVFPPALGASSDEALWQVDQRTHLLEETCEHEFTDELKTCLVVAGGNSAEIEACQKEFQRPDQYDVLAKRLAHIGDVATAIVAVKKKPASFSCAKVLALYYGDAAWKQKLDGFKPAERKRMIDDSRKLMKTACASWPEITRACVIAGGDAELCFDEDNRARWGYPAIGSVQSVGIKECDDYSAAVQRFASCKMLSDAARTTITRSQQQLLAEIARQSATDRAKMATSCEAGMEAVTSALADSGC
jgi:hypothetical protein